MPTPNNIEVLFAELDNFQFFCWLVNKTNSKTTYNKNYGKDYRLD